MMKVRIISPNLSPDDAECAVTVQIRDTSLADTLHPVVAEAHARFPENPQVPFDVDLSVPTDRPHGRHYSVWVHCDHSGDGSIGTGDLITTQSFPVDLDSHAVEVTLTRV